MARPKRDTEFFVIAGLSGAGRSTAADAFEDLGWFVIDNLPPSLIGKVSALVSQPNSETERVVLVLGTAPGSLTEFSDSVGDLRKTLPNMRLLFLEASDEALVRRYEGTRRPHPFSDDRVVEAVAQERELLEPVKAQADVVIDTSELNVHQLRERLMSLFSGADPNVGMLITVTSFGFKNGLPIDADVVFDCRFLPNPYWVDDLRDLTGIDPAVREYVLKQEATVPFVDKIFDLMKSLFPSYIKEGKSYLNIAIGCTGGRHRSVAVAEELVERIEKMGLTPVVHHRDIDR